MKTFIHPKKAYELFHELSSYRVKIPSHPTLESKDWPKEWTQIVHKSYSRLRKIDLPQEEQPIEMNLGQALHSRHSERNVKEEPLRLIELSTLLRHSSGARDMGPLTTPARRTYPSAGGRFPLEIYILILRCEGLEPGIYHYHPWDQQLTPLIEGLLSDQACKLFNKDYFADARALLMVTSVMNRSIVKYGERGYRFVLLEAGHMMQNFCLVGTAIGVPVTPIGGFADQFGARLLDLDETDEILIYGAVLP